MTSLTRIGCCATTFGAASPCSTGMASSTTCLLKVREIPAALRTVADFPNLRFVVDHIAKPNIAANARSPWSELMDGFKAHRGHVWCKLSGMAEEADWASWTPEQLSPFVRPRPRYLRAGSLHVWIELAGLSVGGRLSANQGGVGTMPVRPCGGRAREGDGRFGDRRLPLEDSGEVAGEIGSRAGARKETAAGAGEPRRRSWLTQANRG